VPVAGPATGRAGVRRRDTALPWAQRGADRHVPAEAAVAGYSTQPNTQDEPVLQAGYDWAAIRSHARDLYFMQIVRDDGHFGDHDQLYPTFELLDKLIDR
jgi:hypothetical protein